MRFNANSFLKYTKITDLIQPELIWLELTQPALTVKFQVGFEHVLGQHRVMVPTKPMEPA